MNNTNINWYPGHMTKAVRQMKEDIKLIDLLIELLDARTVISSRNPDIDKLGQNKARIVLLNKTDLADPIQNDKWTKYFEDNGITTLKIDSRNKKTLKKIDEAVKIACKEKIERNQKKGVNRPIRAMVVGIPNVGKSTFINSYAGKSVAKTGNKPGVTKGKQWIRLNKNLELLDTPGILWPKFEDQTIGLHLALVGTINDNILDSAEMAFSLLKILEKDYKDAIVERYGFEPKKETIETMYEIARIRGCIKRGNEPDLDRASKLIIDDFRSGKLGRISLDRV